MPEAFVAWVFCWSVGCLPRAFSGISSGQRLLCILGVRLHTQGSRRLSLIVCFSIELSVQCDGCLIWGLGWRAGLVAGLRVGHAYGVFYRPGFGLLVSVPRSLSTQPPFATQALIGLKSMGIRCSCESSLLLE